MTFPPSTGDTILLVDEQRCAWRQVGEEIVLLDLTGSVYFGLNASAARLWPMLLAGTSRDDLTAALTGLVGGPRADGAEQEVRAFLDALDRAGLLLHPVEVGTRG